jgi:hypothetical protein
VLRVACLVWLLLSGNAVGDESGGARVPGAALDEASVLLNSDFEVDLAPWRGDPLPRMGSQPLSLFTEPDGNRCLRADPDDDFHAFGVKAGDLTSEDVEVADWPWLSWRWQISQALVEADATKKTGDDYAARLYLVFSDSRWNPLAVRTLVYIWDNLQPVGTTLPSTWAPRRARMIVLRSGNTQAGRWVAERRNVQADFIAAFGYEPPTLKAIVVAADTDQTGEAVTTLFDDVILAARSPRP